MLHPKQRQVLFGIGVVMAVAVAAPSPLGAFTVPTPSGFKILYMFAGARDTTNAAINSAATSVHCTNSDVSKDAAVIVEFVDFDNTPIVQLSATIGPQRTFTFSSQGTAFYAEDATASIADDLNQGSVAVLGDRSSKKVICTAVVIDPVNNPPTYIHTLPLYNSRAKF